MMRTTTAEKLAYLQKTPQNIRNICILAHVDHGKTTLADSLVASNGIISQKMSGKIRYMDSREDEQSRGITMKSSAISLHYVHEQDDYLINLIDSPGHVDFSSEVSTAVRLCDGAIIVVDVIEGVSPQTHAVLRQAWQEGIQPVLMLNKIDRLIVELHMEPQEAYLHLQRILEHVNVLTSELFTSDWMEKTSNMPRNSSENSETWSADLNMVLEEEGDDSHIYFSPDQGNVIFASALDGWGFSISHFVNMYSEKLGIKAAVLNKTLWGNYYLNSKAKRIMKGAQAKNKKPLFVQFVLENLWAVYHAVMIKKDKEMVAKIVNSLNLKISARDSRSDPKLHLQAICSQWLPLSNAVLSMVAMKIPAPTNMSKARIEKLMSSNSRSFELLPQKSQDLRNDFLACSSSENAPVIIFVSKMVPIERKSLPQKKIRPLSEADLQEKRKIALQRRAERLAAKTTENTENIGDKQKPKESLSGDPVNNDTDLNGAVETQSEHVFIAFARIFSGTVKKGCKLYVLGPKHDPEKALQNEESTLLENSDLTVNELSSNQHIMSFRVQNLYLFMGRELEIMDEVPAGNVLGIGNLEEYVLKTATLCETIACPAFTDMFFEAAPIVRVAIEPQNICDMPNLVKGLRLLNQADPCVEVLVQETGEHVIIAAGEVHLRRCLEDLTDRYANIEIIASSPIVPFRETIINPPKTDMVNEAIVQVTDKKCLHIKNIENGTEEIRPGLVEMQTSNRKCTICISAKPLPEEVTNILEKSTDVLKYFQAQIKNRASKGDQLKYTEINHVLDESVQNLKKQLTDAFSQAGKEWQGFTDHIWSFGPRHVGPNILVNKIPNYQRPSLWNITDDTTGTLHSYDDSIISGFQMATLSGPLCEEPMYGVCFIIEQWDYLDTLDGTTSCCISDNNGVLESRNIDLTYSNELAYGPFSGQLMSTIKDGCRKVFLTQSMRLMVAMYKCDIQATADVLGKLYAVLGKRNGKVLYEDMREGTQVFNIQAALPIIESFGFAEDIRKKTSGLASPQLRFSHWEVVDLDPFWVPQTEEEYLHFGEKADSVNLARSYMNAVRKRKGLKVNEKIVEHAEKQRTLKKNK